MIHGSFGLYYKSLPGDVRLENTKVKGFNPVTGQTETRPYGHFREIYLHGTDIGLNKANPILSKMPKGITKRILFERIRKQAERALKDGYYINEENDLNLNLQIVKDNISQKENTFTFPI